MSCGHLPSGDGWQGRNNAPDAIFVPTSFLSLLQSPIYFQLPMKHSISVTWVGIFGFANIVGNFPAGAAFGLGGHIFKCVKRSFFSLFLFLLVKVRVVSVLLSLHFHITANFGAFADSFGDFPSHCVSCIVITEMLCLRCYWSTLVFGQWDSTSDASCAKLAQKTNLNYYSDKSWNDAVILPVFSSHLSCQKCIWGRCGSFR